MIAYFDTSSLVPLLIDEPSSESCVELWNAATRVVSVRVLYAEARAALAQAQRMGRIETEQLRRAVDELDRTILQVDHIEITADLVELAGDLAEAHQLRGYDAVHLAGARTAADDDLVVVTGDADLARAATALHLSTART